MKAYIVNGTPDIVNFMPELEVTNKLSEAKIVIFGEGPIVSPSLYKEKKASGVDMKCDINRDRSDKAVYTKMRPDQLAVGIGRGACFLAVMNGAKLVQYAFKRYPNHSYEVEFKCKGKSYTFPAISDWNQSINLSGCSDFRLLGRSRESQDYIASPEIKRFMKYNGDPEMVVFHKANSPVSMCIQFHPEWMPNSYLSKFVKERIYECANS
jgi:gamma-glutamyl-gamma-aminobutyrate hydrolase PuuD